MYTLYGITILIQILLWIKYGNKLYFDNDNDETVKNRSFVMTLLLIVQIIIAIGLILTYLP